jgi:hypothetical protein
MTVYEYRIEPSPQTVEATVAFLNDLGSEGWRLVHISPTYLWFIRSVEARREALQALVDRLDEIHADPAFVTKPSARPQGDNTSAANPKYCPL